MRQPGYVQQQVPSPLTGVRWASQGREHSEPWGWGWGPEWGLQWEGLPHKTRNTKEETGDKVGVNALMFPLLLPFQPVPQHLWQGAGKGNSPYPGQKRAGC